MGRADIAGETVGFIGLGAMGSPMARRLIDAGLTVCVYDSDEERLQMAVRCGASAGTSAADVAARARVVFIMVVNGEQTRSVLFGPAGLTDSASTGDCVVICSTIGPGEIRHVASELQAREIHLVDAPVSGGVARAESGDLLIMVGANEVAARH